MKTDQIVFLLEGDVKWKNKGKHFVLPFTIDNLIAALPNYHVVIVTKDINLYKSPLVSYCSIFYKHSDTEMDLLKLFPQEQVYEIHHNVGRLLSNLFGLKYITVVNDRNYTMEVHREMKE